MSCLTVLSLPSAALLSQPPAAAVVPEVAPWRGILAVEPDIAELKAKSLLLTRAHYCVTQATGAGELFRLRGTKAVALAILSDRLGRDLLATVAATVRRQWPRTRIVILGQGAPLLDDYLYDEQLSRSPDPQQVLTDLESLYAGMWNQRTNTIDWSAPRSTRGAGRPCVSESHPTTPLRPAPARDRNFRDRNADMGWPANARN